MNLAIFKHYVENVTQVNPIKSYDSRYSQTINPVEIMIARVFPRRTKMTPTDDNAFVGLPPLGCPFFEEVHISVCFTWDIPKAHYLATQWLSYGSVRIGGPAVSGSNGEFISGRYLKKGVTITSRGCPNNCPWCFVPRWEGKLKELNQIAPGNIVQDNNLLACSKTHLNKVFSMLRNQRAIEFSGGLEASRLSDWIIEELRGLKINQIFLSYDSAAQKRSVQKAVEKLKRYFKRDKIRCYVLIGYKGDSLEKAEERLRWAWDIGTLPFAMRYRTPEPLLQGTYLFTDRRWNLLTRQWTRPAIIKATMKG